MKKTLLILLTLSIFLWVGFIFYFSSQSPVNSEKQATNFYRFLQKLDETLDFTKTNLYVRLRSFLEKAWFPNKVPKTSDLVRKTAHFGLYFVLGIACFFFGLLYNKKILSAIAYGIGLPTIIAVFDEYNQKFYHRGSSLDDVIIDMTGAAFGVLLSLIVYSIFVIIKSVKLRKRRLEVSTNEDDLSSFR
ncbi:VanZ family protein [Pseudothermotoga thermarum]|uniref:Integral membrane protein-like protein n=1 Tax=Pseudothermotoga thermarum DSM 5069 TaxID=688269 RepID=F7YVL9_9THEM|nr:VanZ family protein [Pseudothermotoga thermarum]AEH51680.1 integral membrane protein-like protein [Pseudothermotoga thermarum DSM 5069]